eukprot:377715_1
MAEEKVELKDDSYKIPNALDKFDEIIPNKNNLLLFLDYDGTLSEIVSDPDKAILTESMAKILVELSTLKNVYMIITTGRSIKKVKSFVIDNKNIHFAGNHGIEIEFVDNNEKQLFVDEESVKSLHSAYIELKDVYKVCDKYKGTQIEYKTYSMSLHYRNIKMDNEKIENDAINEMNKIMQDISNKYKIHFSTGKKVFELKCVNDWNKGYAIKWILENRLKVFKNFKDSNNGNNLMFIGDDVTDEDGFDALVNYGKNDKINDNISSILVTHNKVRQTKASYYVNAVKDVEILLAKIIQTLK